MTFSLFNETNLFDIDKLHKFESIPVMLHALSIPCCQHILQAQIHPTGRGWRQIEPASDAEIFEISNWKTLNK